MYLSKIILQKYDVIGKVIHVRRFEIIIRGKFTFTRNIFPSKPKRYKCTTVFWNRVGYSKRGCIWV